MSWMCSHRETCRISEQTQFLHPDRRASTNFSSTKKRKKMKFFSNFIVSWRTPVDQKESSDIAKAPIINSHDNDAICRIEDSPYYIFRVCYDSLIFRFESAKQRFIHIVSGCWINKIFTDNTVSCQLFCISFEWYYAETVKMQL